MQSLRKTLWKLERLKIFQYLKQHRLVKRYVHRFRGFCEFIYVVFTDNTREVWAVNNQILYRPYYKTYPVYYMPIENCLTGDRPIRFNEFESIDNCDDSMFIITYEQLKKLAFVDRRMFIHELADELANEGWVKPQYPVELLIRDFETIVSHGFKSHLYTPNRIAAVIGRQYRYTRLIEHFLPIDLYCGDSKRLSIREVWTHKYLYLCIRRLVQLKMDVSRNNIIGIMQTHTACGGPKIDSPNMWCAILHRFAPGARSIRDIDPGWGSKTLAAAAMGMQYRFENFQHVDAMVELADFIGLDAAQYNNEQSDLCILSNHPLSASEAITRLEKYNGCHKRTIIIVHRDGLKTVSDKYKPNKIGFITYCNLIKTIHLNTHHILLYQK